MSIITILEKQVFTFSPWGDGKEGLFYSGDKLNTWTEPNIELNTEYLVTWDNGIQSKTFSTYAVQKGYPCLGNLSLWYSNEPDTGEPFLLVLTDLSWEIHEAPSISLFLTNDTSATAFALTIKRNINDNVVLKNPQGTDVTYGEYDTILLNAAGGHKLYYHRLPGLTEEDDGKILVAQNEVWTKSKIPQSDWEQTDATAANYILNKPTDLATTQYVREQIATIPAQAQANWKETNTKAPSYILNKPTIPDAQIPSDWEQTNDKSVDFIKNVPEAMKHQADIAENEQLVLMDTAVGWIKQSLPQLLMTVTFEDETVKNYHIVGTEVSI